MTLLLAIGGFCFAFLLALVLNQLALRPWRRSIGSHWTERARLLYPTQKSAALNNTLIPLNSAILSYAVSPDVDFLKVAISGFAGSMLASYFMSGEIFPELKFKSWIHLVAAGIILFGLRRMVIFYAIFEMPDNFGMVTWVCAVGILILLLAFNFGLGTRLLRLLRLLEPATDHLKALVTEMSQKMNVPVKVTWIISTYASNAMALPLTRELIFTDKLLVT